MEQGWVKFYREWLDNPYICKDGEHMAVWMYLMLNATHKEKQVNFGKQVITLKVGQLLTSQREIARKLKINRGKVDRIFALFKSVALIVARTNMQQSIVTIELWDTSQNESVARNVAGVWHECGTEQETENEKEKRSKREKDKEKEINKNEKNERSVCVGAHTYGHTRSNLLFLGRYKNVVVSQEFYEEFKEKYWYYDKVIDKLSAYKKARNIVNDDDIPYIEQFAIEDKDKYIKPGSSFDTFDADEFFEAALKRSYAKDDDEW